MQTTRIVVTCVVVLLMLDGGLRPPVGRLFSWPMYAWSTTVVAEIRVCDVDGDERSVNLYDDIPRGEFLVPPDRFDLYLDYLRAQQLAVRAVGTVHGPFGRIEFDVADHDVVAAGA